MLEYLILFRSWFMNIRILLLGLSIMIISNSLMLTLVSALHVRSFVSMLLFTIISLFVWLFFLKKDVPIGIGNIKLKTFRDTFPLLLVPIIGSLYFLNTSENINYGIVSLMLVTSLSTGIYEEFIFRGIAFGSLFNAGVKPYKSILISALIFSLFHLYSAYSYESIDIVLKMINTFMMGVIFAYIYHLTKNILYVIAIHTLWDFESFLAQSYLTDNIGESISIVLFAMTVLYFSWSYKKILSGMSPIK